MNIYDISLKNGKTFFGESGIINIYKLTDYENLKESWKFKEICPYCETLATNNALSLPGITSLGQTLKVSSMPKNYIFIFIELKDSYDKVRNNLENLNENDFNCYENESFFTLNHNPTMTIAFDKEKVRNFYKVKKITKKTREELFKAGINLAIKGIWKSENLSYKIKYFSVNGKSVELKTYDEVFYGPTMNKNGIKNFLKENCKEDFLKILTNKKIPNTKTYITQLWKNIYINSNTIKENFPEIKINNYGEIIELELNEEKELFSKKNLTLEVLFHDKGKIGTTLQPFMKKQINEIIKKEL